MEQFRSLYLIRISPSTSLISKFDPTPVGDRLATFGLGGSGPRLICWLICSFHLIPFNCVLSIVSLQDKRQYDYHQGGSFPVTPTSVFSSPSTRCFYPLLAENIHCFQLLTKSFNLVLLRGGLRGNSAGDGWEMNRRCPSFRPLNVDYLAVLLTPSLSEHTDLPLGGWVASGSRRLDSLCDQSYNWMATSSRIDRDATESTAWVFDYE